MRKNIMQRGFGVLWLLVTIWILAVVLSVILVGNRFLGNPVEKITNNPKIEKIRNSIPSLSPKIATDEAKNWKTYENTDFSFEYPRNLRLIEKNDKNSKTDSTDLNISLQPIYIPLDGNYEGVTEDQIQQIFYLNITVSANTNHLKLERVKENLLKEPSQEGPEAKAVREKKKNSIKEYVNGQIRGLYYMDGWDYDFDNVTFVSDKYIYSVRYNGENGGKIGLTQEKLVQEILSTFKFLK